MKILFVSNHNPHFVNSNVYREKAIKELGHDIIFFDERKYLFPGRIRQKLNWLQQWDFKRLNNKLIKVANYEKPDLCIVMGGRATLPLPNTLEEIKSIGSKTVMWTTDPPNPWSFSLIVKTAPIYDHIFCSGTEAIEILREKSLKDPVFLPFGCDPDYHHPVKLKAEDRNKLAKDVVFVGSFYPNRWEILKELNEFELGVWGPYWNKAISRANRENLTFYNFNHLEWFGNSKTSVQLDNLFIKSIKLDPSEWIKIYSASKIVIVIHYQDGEIPCYQASPKVYEALACGCFVLVDRQKDVFSLFEDEKHLVGFDNVNDLKRKIIYYLANPDKRRKIAESGRQMVLAQHTFRHRVETLLETVFGNSV